MSRAAVFLLVTVHVTGLQDSLSMELYTRNAIRDRCAVRLRNYLPAGLHLCLHCGYTVAYSMPVRYSSATASNGWNGSGAADEHDVGTIQGCIFRLMLK
jgi:hypothetical protein